VRAELLLVLVLALAACASEPRPVDPPRLKSALEAESDGAKRFQRGDFTVAERRFAEAAKLFASIDDDAGNTRNRLHLARVRLAQGRAGAALELLEALPAAAASAELLSLKGQALLALGRTGDAARVLVGAEQACAAPCPGAASLAILQGRVALAQGDAAMALGLGERALQLLRDRNEPNETGNAWRLLAAARLARGDAAALAAAQAALDIDRRLALPEKIARDWLLIGDIHRHGAQGKTAEALEPAATAYRKARSVASAAGLEDISLAATQSLQAIGMGKNPAE
jgi:tetratricopeptide (TPR) repeat protein